jgi:uncharacterized protein
MSEDARRRIPLPRPTALSKPHWDGCRAGRLLVQRCRDCGHPVWIPQPVCTACLSDALDWVESAGRGSVYSLTTVHRPPRPEFEVPYTVAIVELDEGHHLLTNLVECAPEERRIGQRVEVVFRPMSDAITLPYFRPRT